MCNWCVRLVLYSSTWILHKDWLCHLLSVLAVSPHNPESLELLTEGSTECYRSVWSSRITPLPGTSAGAWPLLGYKGWTKWICDPSADPDVAVKHQIRAVVTSFANVPGRRWWGIDPGEQEIELLLNVGTEKGGICFSRYCIKLISSLHWCEFAERRERQ